jgi:hypothetical protein
LAKSIKVRFHLKGDSKMSDDSKTGSNPQREQAQQRHQDQDITKGDHFVAEEHDGSQITINQADDPKYPEGSQYISRQSSEGDKDPTMIVGPEGDILNEADSDDGGDDGGDDGDSDGGDSDGGDGGDGGGGDGGE